MTTTSLPIATAQPCDAVHWTRYLTPLKVPRTPTGALNLNVDGRHILGPLQGFGQLWKKTFRIQLNGQRQIAGGVIKRSLPRFSAYFWVPRGEVPKRGSL
jgi:hypothetical protein